MNCLLPATDNTRALFTKFKGKQKSKSLSKHHSVRKVFCSQMSGLISAAQLRVQAIAGDQDIEHLHQYRVSLRQARALLNAFHGIFPAKTLLDMDADIKALFRASGQLRDLDLLQGKLHRAAKTSSNKKLNNAIKVKRQQAFEQFLLASESNEFKYRFIHLRLCLNGIRQSKLQISLNDCWPSVIETSLDEVQSAYKKVWKQACHSHIHSLRKALKQLRYCVELLGVFIKPDKAKKLLSWLSKQQDSLGKYNDLKVQSGLLKDQLHGNRKAHRSFLKDDLLHLRQSLPLSKSHWKTLKHKLQPMLC